MDKNFHIWPGIFWFANQNFLKLRFKENYVFIRSFSGHDIYSIIAIKAIMGKQVKNAAVIFSWQFAINLVE
jgi:hypothetical protein